MSFGASVGTVRSPTQGTVVVLAAAVADVTTVVPVSRAGGASSPEFTSAPTTTPMNNNNAPSIASGTIQRGRGMVNSSSVIVA